MSRYNTYYGGDAYPNFYNHLGPGLVSAFMGSPYVLGETTKLNDIGQTVIMKLAAPDISEIELCGEVATKIRVSAGFEAPISIDLAAGTRVAVNSYPMGPIARILNKGDTLIFETVLQSGMVFTIEPGAYAGKNGTCGARLEKVLMVTSDGAEVLSGFEWRM